jgi:hypothetical protein
MTVGIYSIVLNNCLVYVGKSDNIESRIKSHTNTLDRGVHPNYKMQRAYDEFKDSFTYHILEECGDHELLTKERIWIEEFDAENTGLNIHYRGSQVKGFAARGQPLPTLISPDGEELTIQSLSEFCDLYNLDMGAMHHVIFNSKNRKSHKGWRLKV